MILNLSPQFQINLAAPPYDTEGLSMIIFGQKGSGKSHVLAVLAEEAHSQGLTFIFFDINGDAAGLRLLGPDVMIVGRTNHKDPQRRADFDIADASNSPAKYIKYALVAENDHRPYSIVFDLSGRPRNERALIFANLVNTLYEISEDIRRPHLVLIDEAHNFSPQRSRNRSQRESAEAFDLAMSDGRKRGILLAVATQRPQELDKSIVRGMSIRLFGKIHDPVDLRSLRDFLLPTYTIHKFRQFRAGQFLVWSAQNWMPIQIKKRRSADLGGTPVPQPDPRPAPDVVELKQGRLL